MMLDERMDIMIAFETAESTEPGMTRLQTLLREKGYHPHLPGENHKGERVKSQLPGNVFWKRKGTPKTGLNDLRDAARIAGITLHRGVAVEIFDWSALPVKRLPG